MGSSVHFLPGLADPLTRKKLLEALGNKRRGSGPYVTLTEEKIRQDPYILLEVAGWTMPQVDSVARACGVPTADRTRRLVLYALKTNLHDRGNSMMESAEIRGALQSLGWDRRLRKHLISDISSIQRVQTYCDMLEEGQELRKVEDGAIVWERCLQQERAIMRFAGLTLDTDFSSQAASLLQEEYTGVPLSAEQAAAVATAFGSARLSLITGHPGCGKSASCNAIAQMARAKGWRSHFVAFTWLAAQRISQLCPGTKATSIHKYVFTVKRLLKQGAAAFDKSDEPCWFDKDEEEASPACVDHWPHLDLLVVDEASMASTSILCMLLQVLPAHTRVVLVGDEAQLPPIGFGQPFADLVAAARAGGDSASAAAAAPPPPPPPPPMTELTHVFRTNEPHIVGFAASCRRGLLPNWLSPGDLGDFVWLPGEAENTADILAILQHTAGAQADTQILVAGKQGPLGMWAINAMAADVMRPAHSGTLLTLRPDQHVMCMADGGIEGVPRGTVGVVVPGPRIKWRTGRTTMVGPEGADEAAFWLAPAFVVGDKVMFTDRAHPEVRNGERGFVREVRGKRVQVEYSTSGSDTAKLVWHDHSQQGHLQLAYAVTIHKYQGNEVQHAVVVVHPSHGSALLTRNLLYTAVTRGKQRVTLLCSAATLQKCVATPARRRTCLAVLLSGRDVV